MSISPTPPRVTSNGCPATGRPDMEPVRYRFTRYCKAGTVDCKQRNSAALGKAKAAARPQAGTPVPAQVRTGDPPPLGGHEFPFRPLRNPFV